MNTKKDNITKILHWGFAYFILTMLVLGFTMKNTEYSLSYYQWHKSLGVIFSLFVGIRLYWRIVHPWQSLAIQKNSRWADVIHKLLIILLCIMPITGLLNSGFSGFSVHLFDLVIIPENINVAGHNEPFNRDIYETAKLIHNILAYVFVVFIFIHIAAALKHHVIDKDNTLRNMLFNK